MGRAVNSNRSNKTSCKVKKEPFIFRDDALDRLKKLQDKGVQVQMQPDYNGYIVRHTQ